MSIPNCETCQRWKRHDFTTVEEPLGDCRKDPPRIVDAIVTARLAVEMDSSEAVEMATRWPMTRASDGCGQHESGIPL